MSSATPTQSPITAIGAVNPSRFHHGFRFTGAGATVSQRPSSPPTAEGTRGRP